MVKNPKAEVRKLKIQLLCTEVKATLKPSLFPSHMQVPLSVLK